MINHSPFLCIMKRIIFSLLLLFSVKVWGYDVVKRKDSFIVSYKDEDWKNFIMDHYHYNPDQEYDLFDWRYSYELKKNLPIGKPVDFPTEAESVSGDNIMIVSDIDSNSYKLSFYWRKDGVLNIQDRSIVVYDKYQTATINYQGMFKIGETVKYFPLVGNRQSYLLATILRRNIVYNCPNAARCNKEEHYKIKVGNKICNDVCYNQLRCNE